MADKSKPPVPGNYLQRFLSWLWYGVVMALHLGPVPMIREMFHKITPMDYTSMAKQTEEIAVLTGGTRGLGAVVLKKLLQLDYTVIMGARNIEAGEKILEKIRNEGISTGKVQCFPLDLKSLKSVRSFAEKVLEEVSRIDLLINNAGIMFEPWEVTEDNFEVHFHVNYLSHFLLTQLLLPKMKETGSSRKTKCRIVNVSSLAHYGSSGENIKVTNYPKVYSAYKAYFDSKLCQVMSTGYLNTLLHAEGANISVYSVHPGIIPTDLYNAMGCFGSCFKSMRSLFRSIDEGAEEIMLAAVSPDFENEGGCYIQNSKKNRPLKAAEKEKYQKVLWELSQKCISQVLSYESVQIQVKNCEL